MIALQYFITIISYYYNTDKEDAATIANDDDADYGNADEIDGNSATDNDDPSDMTVMMMIIQ